MESRERKSLFAPPRTAVPVPGAPSAFGAGFWRRYRASGAGCFLTLFIALGAALLLFGLAGTVGPYADSIRGENDPRSLLGFMAMGGVFVLVALRMLQVVLTETEHRGRLGRGADNKEPWTSDHPWRPAGMEPDYAAARGGSILGTVAFLSLIALFNVALGSPSYIFRAVILALDLLGLLILADALRRIFQGMRRARPRMRWTTFPAFLGESLEGVFTTRRPLPATGPVRATLRCVRDEWTIRKRTGRHGRDRRVLEPFLIYTQAAEIPVQGQVTEVPFAFRLPTDLPGTDLMREQAVYWQVLCEVPLAGPDFETVFLAPVYDRRLQD